MLGKRKVPPRTLQGGLLDRLEYGEVTMIESYDGAKVVDAQGERIGTVERSYVDDSGTARFVEVAIGAFFPKHRLIPLAGAQFTSGRLAVPYTMDMIVESPDASSASDTLDGELLEQVQAYWSPASTDVETAGSTEEDGTAVPGEVVLLTLEPETDTAERVVEEEVVVVKRRVVKEVLRARTDQVIEHQTIPDRVEVIQEGDGMVQDKEGQ
jgi:hypothetical protein